MGRVGATPAQESNSVPASGPVHLGLRRKLGLRSAVVVHRAHAGGVPRSAPNSTARRLAREIRASGVAVTLVVHEHIRLGRGIELGGSAELLQAADIGL